MLQEAQRRQRNTLTSQIRRLILIGSYIDSVSQADPASMPRLMKGREEILERDQDRALFNPSRHGLKTPDALTRAYYEGV